MPEHNQFSPQLNIGEEYEFEDNGIQNKVIRTIKGLNVFERRRNHLGQDTYVELEEKLKDIFLKKHRFDTYELDGVDGDNPSSATTISIKVRDEYRIINVRKCIHGIEIDKECVKCK